MYAKRLTVVVPVNGSGAATAYSDAIPYGKLSQIRYVKTDYANGVDFTITSEATGETLWTEANVDASATRAPRQATHGTDGAASLFASGGAAVNDLIALVDDRVKIVIANGGVSKTGTFHIIII